MKRYSGTPGWSNRFKRQFVVQLLIAISPVTMFVSNASNVPDGAMAALFVGAVLAFAVGLWYLRTQLRGPRIDYAETYSERESWILGIMLALLVGLVAFNIVDLNRSHPQRTNFSSAP